LLARGSWEWLVVVFVASLSTERLEAPARLCLPGGLAVWELSSAIIGGVYFLDRNVRLIIKFKSDSD
jgi:hypothetical protein